MTSFLNYLLDSTNELNNSFFVLFSDLIDKHLTDISIGSIINKTDKSIRNDIIDFSSTYYVSCEPEYPILHNDGSRVIPDILLKVIEKSVEEVVAYLIIENKIKKSAVARNQIEKQFQYFKNSEDYSSNCPVISVYITPDERFYESFYLSGKEKNPNTVWLKWVNYTDEEDSIEGVLKKLIYEEQKAEIHPIDLNTKFIIKSFIDYISTEFMQKTSGKKNFSYKGYDVVSSADTDLDGQSIRIKRFSNNMIRLFNSEEELMEVQVKPILRFLNEKLALGVDLHHSTGILKNTQVFGRDVIDRLNQTEG